MKKAPHGAFFIQGYCYNIKKLMEATHETR